MRHFFRNFIAMLVLHFVLILTCKDHALPHKTKLEI